MADSSNTTEALGHTGFPQHALFTVPLSFWVLGTLFQLKKETSITIKAKNNGCPVRVTGAGSPVSGCVDAPALTLGIRALPTGRSWRVEEAQ